MDQQEKDEKGFPTGVIYAAIGAVLIIVVLLVVLDAIR